MWLCLYVCLCDGNVCYLFTPNSWTNLDEDIADTLEKIMRVYRISTTRLIVCSNYKLKHICNLHLNLIYILLNLHNYWLTRNIHSGAMLTQTGEHTLKSHHIRETYIFRYITLLFLRMRLKRTPRRYWRGDFGIFKKKNIVLTINSSKLKQLLVSQPTDLVT